MADAAVGFVVEKLGDLLVQEAINLQGVRDQVEWLKTELQRMQCFLKDADAKKSKGDDERVKNWVSEMRDLAFDAEDIIDTFMYFGLRRQQMQPGFIGFIKRSVFVPDELVSRHKVHADVEGIKAKLHQLSESRISFGIANIGDTTSHSRSQNEIPILPQLKGDIDMVGFDGEKKMIVQEVVDKNNTSRSVISIFGMGGLGKTTLAKSVYNDPQVERSFAMLAWVIISHEYTILKIVKKILSIVSATEEEKLGDILEPLLIKLSKSLEKVKYLIVLDDVWEVDVWDKLQNVLPDFNNGSRVIITTRFSNVAIFPGPLAQPHGLRLLTEEESRELFLRKVFRPKQDVEVCCPENLVKSAEKLVEGCKGLPLALVVLGGLVSTKPKTKNEWERVVESMKGQFVPGGEKCREVLALSYNDLPYYLKLCFLYFGCFREDEDISVKRLIRFWAAEGFLPTKNDKTTEEIGLDCLQELVQRCLIQVTVQKYDDSAKKCRIHDLLREMCINEAKENKFLEIYKKDIVHGAARRLTIFNHVIEPLNYSNLKLRGLVCSHTFDYYPLLHGFKLLRVLCFYGVDNNMSEIPCEIKSLIHLRYLELDGGNLEKVPSWIGHLRILQTFIITGCCLEKISDSLWRIESLRHVRLVISSTAGTPNMGNNIVLKNLQTLQWVRGGKWIGNALPKLTNLRKLKIKEVSEDHADALYSSLRKLGRLASLTIRGRHIIPSDNIITAFSNPHCFKKLHLNGEFTYRRLPRNDVFPQQLAKLVLVWSRLEQDPMPTLEKLPCLKYLRLADYSYTGKQMICSATGFPQLLSLIIILFVKLEEWKIEEGAMPCLKHLKMSSCTSLKVIPGGLKNVPLDQLELISMPEELQTRTKENTGEDWCKIQHVPNISII